MKTPRGIRNNNPLNIRRTTDRWEGESKTLRDKSFVQFKSMEWGYRAAWKILQSYYRKTHRSRGFAVQNIIRRWAPPTENEREVTKMISDTNEYQDWTPYFNIQEGF